MSIDQGEAAIVRAIIAPAPNRAFTAVAESVETPRQLAFLYCHGCGEIQGLPLSAAISRRFAGETLLLNGVALPVER